MDFNPEIFMELLVQDLGCPSGELRSFKAAALKNSVLKKYVLPENEAGFHTEALANFVLLNNKVKDFVISPSFLTSDVFVEWKRVINNAFYSGDLQGPRVTLASAFANGLCGPGASVGGGNNTFFTKMFNCNLTTTSVHLYQHYEHFLSARWSLAEKYRQRDFTVKVVPGSKLSSVPKDRTKNRTTCTEPILNMFYQLGIKAQLDALLKDRFQIDLSTQQDVNRGLACTGSITGALATVDLKDASDSISVELCRHLLPPEFFRLLMYTRSARTHVGKELVDLAMISTMGNGFTFALMTMLFAALVKAIYKLHGVPFKRGSTFGVYGDDIIVTTETVDALYSALTEAGLIVNTLKSFTTGPFRESCGGDFYNGHDVRGIYIKRMTHEAHFYSAFNRLHFWALKHNFDLAGTLKYLKGSVAFRPVPFDTGVDAGFVVTTKELTSPKRDRNGAIIYHGLQNVPVFIEQCGERFDNHHGGLISFLGGYVRNNKMSLRVNSPNYRVAKGVTPIWDYINSPWLNARDLSTSWAQLLNCA